jgi:CubicO group peptidase (beta-lactamase class C family)
MSAVAMLGVMTPAQIANPGNEWERVRPEDVGYSSKRLDALRDYLASIDTTAMMAVHKGRVIVEYGDVAQQGFQLTSVRKSLLALLYGKYVVNGTINLDATLEELGIDDVGGLLSVEKRARVRHLLASRSGVFHKNVNPNGGDSLWAAPPRGTQATGTYFLYNNWDFNVAGFIFEKLTGQDIFDAFERDVAIPIGMQDFDRKLQVKERDDPTLSNYPAFRFSLTVRDMARVGQLMLQKGVWNGKQVVPSEWIATITSLVTPLDQINPPSERYQSSGLLWGYGHLWWVWDDHGSVGPFQGAYSAIGNIGQFITVFPALDLVVAHKTLPAPPRQPARAVRLSEYQTVLMQLTTARCRGACQ